MTDEILTVNRVSKDGGEYIVKCPHCDRIIGIEGDDLSEIRGEQYHHRKCDGWLQVGFNAKKVSAVEVAYVSLASFKATVERNGWPNGTHWRCPACDEPVPDDVVPVDGLTQWSACHQDAGGSGWACVCCRKCGNHYAADISN